MLLIAKTFEHGCSETGAEKPRKIKEIISYFRVKLNDENKNNIVKRH